MIKQSGAFRLRFFTILSRDIGTFVRYNRRINNYKNSDFGEFL